MAASTVIKNLNDGSVTVEDGTGSPVSLSVPFTVGDVSIDGLGPQQNEVTAYETRGSLNTVRHTTRTYPTVSFSAQLADYSDGTDGTLVDFCLFQASYSANVSTLGANADVKTIKLTLTVEGTDHGDSADHTIVMDDVYVTVAVAEGDPNTVTISGTIYGSVVMT
jgi:hypothetical protein